MNKYLFNIQETWEVIADTKDEALDILADSSTLGEWGRMRQREHTVMLVAIYDENANEINESGKLVNPGIDPNCKRHGKYECGNEPGCRCHCHEGGYQIEI